MWVAVRRLKTLPEGGNIESVDLQSLETRLKRATKDAGKRGQLKFDEDARIIWREDYADLSEGKPRHTGQ